MKLSAIRDTALFILLISIPFTYNACQGGFHSKKSSSSSAGSTSCKLMMVEGKAQKIVYDNDIAPSPFAGQKSQLRTGLEAAASASFQQKSDGSLQIAAGTELAVIINNLCVQESEDNLEQSVITKAALLPGEMQPEMKRQAYLWKLDQAYSESEIEAIAALEPCVVGVSWNHEYTIEATDPISNDPDVQTQQLSAFNRVNAAPAYKKFYNDEGGMADTGSPVIIAVMDTGVDYSHQDLQANLYPFSSGWGVDATTLPYNNPDYNGVNYNPMDVSSIGHGTHVAGLIAAVTNNSIGIAGMMPKRAKIMAIKVFTSSNTTTSQYFYNGVHFAFDNGASVINISLGAIKNSANSDPLALSAFEEATAHGLTVISVIGNANTGEGALVNNTTLSSIPGQYSTIAGVIGVGSIDSDTGNKSYFSHYSPVYAEIGAPGAQSFTTDSTGKKTAVGLYSLNPVAKGSYRRLAGTSQAAPLVSAAAGLVIGIVRDATGQAPSPAEVERLILGGAKKQTSLASYFKNGNTLDLNRLANYVNQQYPATTSKYTQPVGSECE